MEIYEYILNKLNVKLYHANKLKSISNSIRLYRNATFNNVLNNPYGFFEYDGNLCIHFNGYYSREEVCRQIYEIFNKNTVFGLINEFQTHNKFSENIYYIMYNLAIILTAFPKKLISYDEADLLLTLTGINNKY